jgi:hypothetical protein
MTDSQKPADSLTGRFVVDLDGERWTGLTVQAVIDLLAKPHAGSAVIYRIHHADPAGRLALVGVSANLFQIDDGLIFQRHDAATARTDFDAIRAAGRATPPPCRVHVHLTASTADVAPNAVVLIFPAACTDSVGHWLQRCHLRPGDNAEGGIQALRGYLAAEPQLLEMLTLETNPLPDAKP